MPNFDFINAKNHKSDCKSFEKDFDLATFATENTENSGLKRELHWQNRFFGTQMWTQKTSFRFQNG